MKAILSVSRTLIAKRNAFFNKLNVCINFLGSNDSHNKQAVCHYTALSGWSYNGDALCLLCGRNCIIKYGLDLGRRNFLWQRSTPVIVGWFADRMWKNHTKRYT
jgi:hypothetical protein